MHNAYSIFLVYKRMNSCFCIQLLQFKDNLFTLNLSLLLKFYYVHRLCKVYIVYAKYAAFLLDIVIILECNQEYERIH